MSDEFDKMSEEIMEECKKIANKYMLSSVCIVAVHNSPSDGSRHIAVYDGCTYQLIGAVEQFKHTALNGGFDEF